MTGQRHVFYSDVSDSFDSIRDILTENCMFFESNKTRLSAGFHKKNWSIIRFRLRYDNRVKHLESKVYSKSEQGQLGLNNEFQLKSNWKEQIVNVLSP